MAYKEETEKNHIYDQCFGCCWFLFWLWWRLVFEDAVAFFFSVKLVNIFISNVVVLM